MLLPDAVHNPGCVVQVVETTSLNHSASGDDLIPLHERLEVPVKPRKRGGDPLET